ncbi:MAG: BON domain-containing protein [Gemmatales bacterium]|nr:BON domain-containing protein [Gemmatales bacterium]
MATTPIPIFRYQLDSTFNAPTTSAPTAVPPRLTQIISSARSLPSRENIQLQIVDGSIVLTGEVATEYERTLAEALLRLEPGVYGLKNNLQVRASTPSQGDNGSNGPSTAPSAPTNGPNAPDRPSSNPQDRKD